MAGCVQRRVSARRTPRRRPPIRIPLAPCPAAGGASAPGRIGVRDRVQRHRRPSSRVAQLAPRPSAPGRIGIRGRDRKAPAALIPRRATHAAPDRRRIGAGRIGVRGRDRKAPAALVPRRATRTRPRDAWRFPDLSGTVRRRGCGEPQADGPVGAFGGHCGREPAPRAAHDAPGFPGIDATALLFYTGGHGDGHEARRRVAAIDMGGGDGPAAGHGASILRSVQPQGRPATRSHRGSVTGFPGQDAGRRRCASNRSG